jgi:imidazole glycerol-phosphate synthase subunit HisF
MVKKRLIFTLLYDNGNFMLSRNFRLQRVGNLFWLKNNYDFSKVTLAIDELVVLNVSRNNRDITEFCRHIKLICKECFVPIAVGGGINCRENAQMIMHSGADKLVVNTSLANEPSLVRQLVETYGSQSIVGSIDICNNNGKFEFCVNNGTVRGNRKLSEHIEYVIGLGVGELYINSIDRDGTGNGYLFDLLDFLNKGTKVPVIIAGGAGNWHHLLEGLQNNMVDAVATAHLFNFIGNGFPNARKQLLNKGIDLAVW